MTDGNIEEISAKAESVLAGFVAGAFCVPQGWDRRIDCLLQLPDGSYVGEMISLDEFSEDRIRATAERLKQRAHGIDVRLVNEIRSSLRITPDDER